MKIGIPKEIKNNESRVSLTPAGAFVLTNAGHEVFVETHAGEGSSFSDEDYKEQGATIVETAKDGTSKKTDIDLMNFLVIAPNIYIKIL